VTPSSARLADLLQGALSELEGEVPRRRWGRGLAYFHEKASESSGPGMSVVALDVLDFLNGKYGLKSGAIAGSESLRAAVQALESESQRILREDPVLAFAYGVVDGGGAPQVQRVKEFIHKARQLELPTGADFTINPVFLLAGTISKPDWTGVHGGRLFPSKRVMRINVAPQADLFGEGLDAFLAKAMAEAVTRAEAAIKRRGLEWSTAPHHKVVDQLL
jgi:hypothetical protein